MLIRIFIWLVMLMGGVVFGFLIDARLFPKLPDSLWFHLISFMAGLLLLRLVLRASRNTGKLLARLGREGDLPRMETNKLVKEGYYACMRHPMHLGLMLFPPALALIVGSLSFLIIIAPLEMFFIVTMVKIIEEPQALRKFGGTYRDYMNLVPFFSFKKACLKKLFSKYV